MAVLVFCPLAGDECVKKSFGITPNDEEVKPSLRGKQAAYFWQRQQDTAFDVSLAVEQIEVNPGGNPPLFPILLRCQRLVHSIDREKKHRACVHDKLSVEIVLRSVPVCVSLWVP